MTQTAFKAPPSEEMVPRALVVAMFALMVLTLGLVAIARLSDAPMTGVVPASDPVQVIEMTLTGDRNGAYTATAPDGSVLAVSNTDANGFIGVMGRVIARKRGAVDAPLDAPITVSRRADGIVSIHDPLTNLTVPLMGYGKDNVAAFAKLLD